MILFENVPDWLNDISLGSCLGGIMMKDYFWNEYGLYIEKLNYEAEKLIWDIVNRIVNTNISEYEEELKLVYHYISLYLFICNKYYDNFPQKNIRDFFCKDYPEGEKIFKTISDRVKPKEQTVFEDRELENYFDFCASVIPNHIKQLLKDNPEDRHWSAVSINGKIKSYLIIKNQFAQVKKPVDIKRYFTENDFSVSDYNFFEKRRLEESAYYRGIQL